MTTSLWSNGRAEAPIFGFNEARGDIVRAVVGRVMAATADPLHALNDAAYHETKRLEGARSPGDQKELAEWQRLARSLGKLADHERRERLEEVVKTYAWDVAGNFDPRVYKVSTKLLPPVVTALLAPREMLRAPERLLHLESLGDRVRVEGPLDKLRKLARLGTLVHTPTHLSNMDSIVFGYALERAGLPPATYGAGKNLFTNPILSFFMQNLGAYRVDRRIKHELYKEILKTYSSVLLERGYHSLFFPGGTRSRSGGVERRLKLGLVGSAHEAYVRTLLAGRERKVFFVPATINYLITLEAETLIADYLSEAGRGRYIIEDDESTRFARLVAFSRKLFDMNAALIIRFGEPLDPFGNPVDDEGVSHASGRAVDTASYVKNRRGEVVMDPSRDAQYARELGDKLCEAFHRETVVLATHPVAVAAFEAVRKASPSPDLFTVLRQRDVVVSRDELAARVVELKARILDLERRGGVRTGPMLRSASGGDIVERALRAFAGYHSTPVLGPRTEGVAIADPKLVFYYQNRLAGHGLGFDALGPGVKAPVRIDEREPLEASAGAP